MSEKLEFPRVLICAPGSGSGKTLITCALLQLIKKNGYSPAAFKCGPDFIDPMFHKKVLGVPSRNLDLFLEGEDGVKRTLSEVGRGKSVGVIEGVMGFFDGQGAVSMDGSSYDLCVKTKTPAILVVNARGMSRSIVPVIKGFLDYSAGVWDDTAGVIKGVILNNISPMIAGSIQKQIGEELGIPVLGYLPKLERELFASRHLGLVMPEEIPEVLEMVDEVADKLSESFDLKTFMKIAGQAGSLDVGKLKEQPKAEKITVGVALDEAFCFYYEDNLELLKNMGAELKFFSPIHDEKIPEVSRLIIGGGYPELHCRELSENKSMLESIRKAANAGMPILAECGGFLYLQKKMQDPEGNVFDMAGVLEGESHMRGKLSHFGYVNLSAIEDNPYLKIGEVVRAHEFHYYDTSENGEVCEAVKPVGSRNWKEYQSRKNVFGGFAHLYYPSNPEMIRRFMETDWDKK